MKSEITIRSINENFSCVGQINNGIETITKVALINRFISVHKINKINNKLQKRKILM